MPVRRVLILDGYTDEPAGLGVPPYIDVYPRYIAGAAWAVDKGIEVRYVTVDEFRRDLSRSLREADLLYDLVVVIAGVVVPGKYLGGKPLTAEELVTWFQLIERPRKVLVGPAARFGISSGVGGTRAMLPKEVKHCFDAVVRGDPEIYVYEALSEGFERAREWAVRADYSLVDRFAVLGAKIVTQHPNHGFNLVAEIETYRGCPRWVSGGCSFCVEPLYGRPVQRDPRSVVKEIEALHHFGVRHVRLGRQADFYTYLSPKLGEEEFPPPNPEAIEGLLRGIRTAAPYLRTLHIDNVNPGTIARHPGLSRELTKKLIRYHTPGDVAAFGVESADPKVIKANNLGVLPEEVLEAIRILNELGRSRGYNGMPELLPGINFVLGLPGESRDTFRYNLELLDKIAEMNLLVRRINVRQVLVLPGTRLASMNVLVDKHRRYIKSFVRVVRERYDPLFLRRLAPPGSVVKELYVEKCVGGLCYARQAGSYPLTFELPCPGSLSPGRDVVDAVAVRVKGRSVVGYPVPLDANRSSIATLAKLPLRGEAIKRITSAKARGTLSETYLARCLSGGELLTLAGRSRFVC